MLILPIKKKWFDMISSGYKKEEYRAINKYYYSRFKKYGINSNREFRILLRNGISSKRPTLRCVVICKTGIGKEMWGANANEACFILKIKKVEKYD